MDSYRTVVTVEDPRRIVITDLPFRSGETVEVVVTSKRDRELELARVRDLFRRTQSLPQVKRLTDEEIAAEIEAARNEA